MSFKFLKKTIIGSILFATAFFPALASADGIVLGGTRIIYPVDAKQTTLSVRNSSSDTTYLVQSWAEDTRGEKSTDFIVTPPLYVSNPGDQNILRILFSGGALPTDRETLYYFNAKAIPSIEKSSLAGKNVLMLAAVTRIKLFVRPAGLSVPAEQAASMLTFQRNGSQIQIRNPSPYHVTLVQIAVDGRRQPDTMVAPFSSETLNTTGSAKNLTFSTINDYGAISPVQRQSL